MPNMTSNFPVAAEQLAHIRSGGAWQCGLVVVSVMLVGNGGFVHRHKTTVTAVRPDTCRKLLGLRQSSAEFVRPLMR